MKQNATGTPPITTTTTYSVDASNAKIVKPGSTTTVSVADVQVGDTVIVQGTVSGTSVNATNIIDGKFGGGRFLFHGGPHFGHFDRR